MPSFERTVEIDATLELVFAFVTDVRNHGLTAPPETREELLDAGDIPLQLGSVVRFRANYGGIRWTMASRITAFDPPDASHPTKAYFRDEQIRGPFALWRHDHWFESTPGGATSLTDRFTYSAPMGIIGMLVDRVWLNARIRRLLEHMQAAEKRLLEADNVNSSVCS